MWQQSSRKIVGRRMTKKTATESARSTAISQAACRERSLTSGDTFSENQELFAIRIWHHCLLTLFSYIYHLSWWLWQGLSQEQRQSWTEPELENSCLHPGLEGKQLNLKSKDNHSNTTTVPGAMEHIAPKLIHSIVPTMQDLGGVIQLSHSYHPYVTIKYTSHGVILFGTFSFFQMKISSFNWRIFKEKIASTFQKY